MVETHLEPPAFASERPDVSAELEEARAALAVQARDRFEKGYRDAVAAAKDIPWLGLESLPADGWNLERWLEPWVNGFTSAAMEDRDASGYDWLLRLGEHLGSLADPSREWRCSSTTYLRGFAQGLHDVWEAVEHQHQGGDEPAGSA
jgi:hypothetical protein